MAKCLATKPSAEETTPSTRFSAKQEQENTFPALCSLIWNQPSSVSLLICLKCSSKSCNFAIIKRRKKYLAFSFYQKRRYIQCINCGKSEGYGSIQRYPPKLPPAEELNAARIVKFQFRLAVSVSSLNFLLWNFCFACSFFFFYYSWSYKLSLLLRRILIRTARRRVLCLATTVNRVYHASPKDTNKRGKKIDVKIRWLNFPSHVGKRIQRKWKCCPCSSEIRSCWWSCHSSVWFWRRVYFYEHWRWWCYKII